MFGLANYALLIPSLQRCKRHCFRAAFLWLQEKKKFLHRLRLRLSRISGHFQYQVIEISRISDTLPDIRRWLDIRPTIAMTLPKLRTVKCGSPYVAFDLLHFGSISSQTSGLGATDAPRTVRIRLYISEPLYFCKCSFV